jgi:hypothetical protein
MALDPYLKWNDLVLGSTEIGELVNTSFQRRFNLHKHSSIKQIAQVVGEDLFQRMYRFALVRNPVDRIVSLYNFLGTLVKSIAENRRITIAELRQDIDELSGSIPELGWYSTRCYLTYDFSRFIRDETLLKEDVAFASQFEMLEINNSVVADYFKLEDISEGIGCIRKRLGLDIDMPHENKSICKDISVNDLGTQDIDYLKNLYKDDYNAFGY